MLVDYFVNHGLMTSPRSGISSNKGVLVEVVGGYNQWPSRSVSTQWIWTNELLQTCLFITCIYCCGSTFTASHQDPCSVTTTPGRTLFSMGWYLCWSQVGLQDVRAIWICIVPLCIFPPTQTSGKSQSKLDFATWSSWAIESHHRVQHVYCSQ